jgi:hypothetical protein
VFRKVCAILSRRCQEGSFRQSLVCRRYQRQQMPYRCQSRNQRLFASISSCLRFAAAMSLALSGLMSRRFEYFL